MSLGATGPPLWTINHNLWMNYIDVTTRSGEP